MNKGVSDDFNYLIITKNIINCVWYSRFRVFVNRYRLVLKGNEDCFFLKTFRLLPVKQSKATMKDSWVKTVRTLTFICFFLPKALHLR
jgi:hypothetical protein